MNNKFLLFLLKNEPNDVISPLGVKIRRIFNKPFRKYIAPSTSKNKFIIQNNPNIPTDRPVIYAATHGLRDDIAIGLASCNRHPYVLFASLPDFYGTLDGPALWANGVVLIDRKDKKSRKSAIPKMKKAIELGADILMYPEGTLNKTENLIVQKIYPGVYQLAKQTNAVVVPMAITQNGDKVYSKVGEPLDIGTYEQNQGLTILRDLMATLKYELFEEYSRGNRKSIGNAQEYWKNFIVDLEAQMLPFYDYEIEYAAQYIDKNEFVFADVFKHLDQLNINHKTAFLFNKRIK